MELLTLFFLPYMGLGLFSGAAIGGAFRARPFGLKGIVILAAVHIALMAGGGWMAATSARADDLRSKLSPTGWVFGLALAYIVGLAVGLFLK